MISVFGSKVDHEELAEVRSSLENQWMGMGPNVKKFEEEFTARLNLPGLTMVDSGSNALYLAVKLLNLPAGTEIIIPAFTWIACAQAVALNSCVPVFCDVELATQNVTRETVEPHVTKKTGAIMVVHYAGKPVDVPGIAELGFPVIEDAAHAVDSKLGDKYCGNLGTVAIYSYDAVKNLATPESGGVTALDPKLVERAKQLRYCGIGKSGFEATANKARWWEYQVDDLNNKMLPNDVVAGIGLAQLRKLDLLQERRREIWKYYQDEFKGVGWLARPVDATANEQHSYFTYCLRILSGRRDELAKHLLDSGIYTTVRYHPLHNYPIYHSDSKLPVCDQLNEEALSIPLHPNLSDDDVARVVNGILEYSG